MFVLIKQYVPYSIHELDMTLGFLNNVYCSAYLARYKRGFVRLVLYKVR